MQNHCKRFFAKFVGKTLQTLAMFLAIYFAKLCTFLQSFLQNYCQIMQTLAKNFLQDFEHWSQRVGGAIVWWIFFFFGVQEFVASLEASTLQSLYLQHNYLSSFGSLATASIPPTVAVCVQYNCQLPPPQSLCPENAGLIARPINECTKFAGTQNLQPPFFPWVT